MTILSMFAIALLSSAHALDLSFIQRQHATLKAELLASLQEGVAPLHSISQNIHPHYDFSVELLQVNNTNNTDTNATNTCMAAMMAPCVNATNLVMFLEAPNATAASSYAEQFCTACDGNATEQYATLISACNITTANETTMYNLLETMTNVVCANPTCVGAFGWASQSSAMRRDPFCMYLPTCGSSFLTASMNLSADGLLNTSTTEYQCMAPQFEILCATDQTNTSIYCTDLSADSDVSALCATSCPVELDMRLMALYEGMCLPMPTVNTSECNYVNLDNICTMNANNELCVELLSDNTAMVNLSVCPEDVFEGTAAPMNCSTECAGELQAFKDRAGCCANFALESSCATPTARTFITDTCGVSLAACGADTDETTNATAPNATTVATNGTSEPSSDGERAVGISASFALYAGLAIVALAALS